MIAEPASKFGRKSTETATAEELLTGFADPETVMPHSLEAEQGVLSCLLQDPSRLMEARLKLQPAAFYHGTCRTLYEELLTMDQEGVPIDPVLLTNRLRDQGKLETAGGPAAVTELFMFIPSPTHFAHYLGMARDKWTLRREIHGHLLAMQLCFRHGKDSREVEVHSTLNDCDAVLQMARDGVKVDMNSSATLTRCLNEHVEYMEELTRKKGEGQMPLIPTGFPTLDYHSGGIARDEYWLITGPTKSGKSILAGNIVKHAANKGWKCKIYTNEIQRRAYAGRFLASESRTFDGRIERHGFENNEQMAHYQQAVAVLVRSIGQNVIIDNAAGKYVEDIIADMRMEAEKGVSLFVVDLIGKLRSRAPAYSRENELATISGKLSDATKNLGIAIIVVAQENDDGAVRESKALGMDCEAWLKLVHVFEKQTERSFSKEVKKPEMIRNQRRLIIELARGFAAGDSILCHFNGARFLLAEQTQS